MKPITKKVNKNTARVVNPNFAIEKHANKTITKPKANKNKIRGSFDFFNPLASETTILTEPQKGHFSLVLFCNTNTSNENAMTRRRIELLPQP